MNRLWLARIALVAAASLAVAACGTHSRRAAPPTPALPSQHFVSRPDLRPPAVRIRTAAHHTAPGYIFLAPKMAVAQAGPMIVDNAGHVVWFRPLDTKGVTDFHVQRYRGKRVLTWWRGRAPMGVGSGSYVIADSSYRVIKTVHAGNGLTGDVHEFLITPRNTALFTVYR